MTAAFGYFACSVASAVSGVWDNDRPTTGIRALQYYIHVAWTLKVRPECSDMWELMESGLAAYLDVRQSCSEKRVITQHCNLKGATRV